jgi:hypothetical protein
MFPPRFHIGRTSAGPAAPGLAEGSGRGSSTGASLRFGLLAGLLALALPSGVSAQALGTMQVTARVLPGRPGWAGLSEARNLARQALLTPFVTSETHRAGLVQARAELTATAGRRRLLVTVDYPRN